MRTEFDANSQPAGHAMRTARSYFLSTGCCCLMQAPKIFEIFRMEELTLNRFLIKPAYVGRLFHSQLFNLLFFATFHNKYCYFMTIINGIILELKIVVKCSLLCDMRLKTVDLTVYSIKIPVCQHRHKYKALVFHIVKK